MCACVDPTFFPVLTEFEFGSEFRTDPQRTQVLRGWTARPEAPAHLLQGNGEGPGFCVAGTWVQLCFTVKHLLNTE